MVDQRIRDVEQLVLEAECSADRDLPDDEVAGIGMQIRNNFGLWGGNTQLLDECTFSSRSPIRRAERDEPGTDEALRFLGRMDADGASQTILRAARDLARSLP